MHNQYLSASAPHAFNKSDVDTGTKGLILPVELCEAVDRSVEECFAKEYRTDELLGDDLTQIRGPLDSLCKRHGLLLETGIAHGFAAQGDRFVVWTQVPVSVSKAAIMLVENNPMKCLEGLHLPVSDSRVKQVIIDVLVFDRLTSLLHVISVKRGGGAQGGRAAREARTDLLTAGLLLKNLLRQQGRSVREVSQVLVDWYGRSGIIARKTVTRETVDEHFGVPIAAMVDAMSARMQAAIAERMAHRLLKAVGRKILTFEDLSSEDDGQGADNSFPDFEEGSSLFGSASFAECLSVLPLRRQGRQMRRIGN